jgi:hypothetical protein
VSLRLTVPFTTALIREEPATFDRTVPSIRPEALVAPEGCVMISRSPRDDDRTTAAPGTGLRFASRTVTVIVTVSLPSAEAPVGEAFTPDVRSEGIPSVPVEGGESEGGGAELEFMAMEMSTGTPSTRSTDWLSP